MINDAQIRAQFPIFNDKSLVYLDSSATTQRPKCVLDAVRDYYEQENANPLRGLYKLSAAATEAYEGARKAVAKFINSPEPEEIIFTRNASESLNLVAYSWGMNCLCPNDEILVTIVEHHSNFLPWQQVASRTGAKLKFLECDEEGHISTEAFKSALTSRTKLVAMCAVSNVLGMSYDIKTFARLAHSVGAVFVADGAQSVPHQPTDVQDLDVDFLAFSGHKMFAPMGIGVLYGKRKLLEDMPPFMYGGEMIETVSRKRATFAPIPHKFEAGTVNAGGAVGLHAAIDYINSIGFDEIERREMALTVYAMEKMAKIPHVNVLGSKNALQHKGIISFTVDGVHPHDIAAIFDGSNICIRAGHHCAQPLHSFLGIPSSARCSLAFYNTRDDINKFISALSQIRRSMGYDE